MSEKFKKFSDALDRLIGFGERLHEAMKFDVFDEDSRARLEEKLGKEKLKKIREGLPSFETDYQLWYSEAQSLVKQVLPDRLSDFQSYYEYPRARKEITAQNYMIRDYLQGLQITRVRGLQSDVIVDGKAALPDFKQQLNIVKAARGTLGSSLVDLTAILQADLFDSEIESAKALAKAGYFRAAGVICGVVIEKHLLLICRTHLIKVRKKHPGISDLNEELKGAGKISVPQWRFIQHLADIRNLCSHAKGQEPTKEQINDLVTGSEKVLKTVF